MMWLTDAHIYDSHIRAFRVGDLEIRGGRISAIAKAPRQGVERRDMGGAWLLPGFFDCHVHICVKADAPDPNNPWGNALPGTIALHAAENARRMLMAGITTARDVGGWDYHEIAVREAVDAGLIPGSRLHCAGRLLSITSSSTPYYRGMYEEADGPEAVRKAARKQFAQGADFIKILATGAITSTKYEKADAIQFAADEVAAAVKIAAENLSYVAAHAHADVGIRNAVACGCRSIEHGSFGAAEVWREMAGRDCWLVPTLCIHGAMLRDRRFAEAVPAHIRDRYESLRDIHIANIRNAYSLGVKIAMGTDAGTPGNLCGENMQELQVMVHEAGMAPTDAIHAATLEAARMMRLEGELGSLEPGKLADIVAVPRDPLAEIDAMREVFFVMKEGRVWRDDRRNRG